MHVCFPNVIIHIYKYIINNTIYFYFQKCLKSV